MISYTILLSATQIFLSDGHIGPLVSRELFVLLRQALRRVKAFNFWHVQLIQSRFSKNKLSHNSFNGVG